MSPRVLKHTPIQVTIHLPSTWEQEVEESTIEVFWNEAEETGTLRVAVLVYSAEAEITDQDLRESISDEDTPTPTPLASGGFIAMEEDESVEDNVAVHNWLWSLAKRVDSNRMAAIVCTYTVDTAFIEKPEVQAELEIIRKAIPEIEVG